MTKTLLRGGVVLTLGARTQNLTKGDVLIDVKAHPAKASRISVLAAYRKRTLRIRPEDLVTGANPASESRSWGLG